MSGQGTHHEDPQEVSRRKKAMARIARLTLLEQSRRYKPLREDDGEGTKESEFWPGSNKKNSDPAEYAKPYKAEYEPVQVVGPSQDDKLASTGDEGSTCDVSDASSTITGNSIPGRLPNIVLGRRFARSRIAPSSVIDFEKTSTVQPPSDIVDDYHTANVDVNEIRREFFSNFKTTKDLPIANLKTNLVNSINSYNVVIVEGSTGCGKTTQVPIYSLEDAILGKPNGRAPCIYVTQPRRIAAKSIAQRVCEEHGWELGSIVGYQVGLDKKVSSQTLLTFCTAGVLLQKLIQDKSLKSYSHIIIDEAHERDADTDLLMMMIRKLMREELVFFRLIIMSATMDSKKLVSYFTFPSKFGIRGMTTPAVCEVATDPNQQPIQLLYSEKLKTTFQLDVPMPSFDLETPELYDECLEAGVKVITKIIPKIDTFNAKTNSTLVFLPGLAEICKFHRMLKPFPDLDIIPLHSTLAASDQYKIFLPTKSGMRKVILATNIAESSITVSSVGFIVDFCLTKTLQKDTITRFPTLRLQWASQDRCTQRAGRTGRCCRGKVFRMVPFPFYTKFNKYAEPELLTIPLELSVLRIKNFQMGEIKALFAIVLDPPPLPEIRAAVLELKQIGALSSTINGKLSDIDGDLTELGRVISALPIDVHLSKLIVIASVLDVLNDAVIIAACLSTNRTVIKTLYGNLLESYDSKLRWANGSYSDLFVSLDVYKDYIYHRDTLGKSNVWLENYCYTRNLDDRKLFEVSAMYTELSERLMNLNIRVFERPNMQQESCRQDEDDLMLKLAFCAAFYPNYFLSQEMDVAEIKKSLCGLDPTKTVIMHSFPMNQVPLYRTQILRHFKERISDNIDYYTDCSRALLVFKDNRKVGGDASTLAALGAGGNEVLLPGSEMERAVYLALKMHETERIYVREYRDEAAYERMSYYHEARELVRRAAPHRLLPPWLLLVEDRPADNRRLVGMSDEEYSSLGGQCYVEVDFNVAQDDEDQAELEQMNAFLAEQDRGGGGGGKQMRERECPVFKDEVRQVRGPTSPIMMKFSSVLQKSRGYGVDVDPTSVNSILLNPDYGVRRRQMLVSATISQTRGNKLLARDTTLMPNIRGLPSVLALLFAQYYRVVFNEATRCLSGVVCGLGWHADDAPLDKDHEVEIAFDVHIRRRDIRLVNAARRYISELIRFIDVESPGRARGELQDKLRQTLVQLLRERRFPIEEVPMGSAGQLDGDMFSLDAHNVPQDQLGQLEEGATRTFLPTALVGRHYDDGDFIAAIRANLSQMERVERCLERSPRAGIRCLLCGGGRGEFLLMHNQVVRHLDAEEHLQRLAEFEKYEYRSQNGS